MAGNANSGRFKKGQDLPDGERCTATSRSRGTRCPNPRVTGKKTCVTHGNRSRAAREKTAMNRFSKNEAKLASLYAHLPDENDPRIRGDSGMIWQIRQTLANIDHYQDQIDALRPRDEVYGLRERTTKEGYEKDAQYEGDEKKYGAAINVWVQLQQWERTHLTKLHKMWIDAGFEKLKYDQQERMVMMLNSAITEMLQNLGKDPHDPDVRNIVRAALLMVETGGHYA